MTIEYRQTDDAMDCAKSAYCSGASLNTDQEGTKAVEGGTPGVTELTATIDANAVDLAAVWWEIEPDAGDNWDAGDWTVRINVTSLGSTALRWDAVYICRVNSACVNQETIGSATGLDIAVDTTGVKSTVVSGAAQTPDAGDKVIIVCLCDNSAGSARGFGFTPDQNITSPFTAGGGGGGATPRYYQQLIGQV